MRHLTTEELLLHCDGALAAELAVHMEECPACRDSWLHLQTVLFEAECALRASVSAEPDGHKIASHRNLELALYPPKNHNEFPLRWSVVYSVAAALTLMVLSGYLSTSQPPAADMPQMAAVPPMTAVPQMAGVPGSAVLEAEPALQEAVQETAQGVQEPAGESEIDVDLVAGPGLNPPQPAFVGDPAEIETPANEAELVRFELAVAPRPQAGSQQVAWIEPPSVSAAPASVPAALIPRLPLATFRAVVEELAQAEPARLSDPLAFANVIEGYWLLTQARVWQEDLHPVWTSRGLLIEGTVEDSEVREGVRVAVLRQSSEPPAFQIRLREDLPAGQQTSRMARVVHTVYRGPAGGAVRRSLLSHFSDAARRSFVSPQPSVLESELGRYVSEVYSSQSELLSHVYALHRFLGRVDADQLASADPQTTRRFRDLVRFHVRALDEREGAIYDRLSEALPRKIWSRRGDAAESNETLDWREESHGLLQATLNLDSNLTALFGSSSMTVDAASPEQSCGELLHRIRTHIRRIKNRTQAL
ncbi:MAG: hypothetical protein WD733_17900 [Bryobacterales bacterium]